MSRAMHWLGLAVAGTLLASGCSSSDDRSVRPVEVTRITPMDSPGAAGNEAIVAPPGAGSSSGGATGEAGAESSGGSAGGAECEGEYECPSVLYWSYASIKVDLPISVAEAADAIFTVCRDDECLSAKGSAKTKSGEGWATTDSNNTAWLDFDDLGPTPFATLKWNFDYNGPPPPDFSQHYSLTVQPVTAQVPTTLFDARVQFTIEAADENFPGEHYCSHCYDIAVATVDARALN